MASEAVIAYWGLVFQIREFAERTYRIWVFPIHELLWSFA